MELTQTEINTLRAIADKASDTHPFDILLSLKDKGMISGYPMGQGFFIEIQITDRGIEALKEIEEDTVMKEMTKENLALQNENLKCEWWTKPINIISALLGIVVALITIYLFILDK